MAKVDGSYGKLFFKVTDFKQGWDIIHRQLVKDFPEPEFPALFDTPYSVEFINDL